MSSSTLDFAVIVGALAASISVLVLVALVFCEAFCGFSDDPPQDGGIGQ